MGPLAIFEIATHGKDILLPKIQQAIQTVVNGKEEDECIISHVHAYCYRPGTKRIPSPYVVVYAQDGRVDEIQEMIASIKKECAALSPDLISIIFIVVPFLCSNLAAQ